MEGSEGLSGGRIVHREASAPHCVGLDVALCRPSTSALWDFSPFSSVSEKQSVSSLVGELFSLTWLLLRGCWDSPAQPNMGQGFGARGMENTSGRAEASEEQDTEKGERCSYHGVPSVPE